MPKQIGEERVVATHWITLDKSGNRLKTLGYSIPDADFRVAITVTADEQFTLVEEAVTNKRRDGVAVPPRDGGWRMYEDRGDAVSWRKPNTIKFSKGEIASWMRWQRVLRARLEGQG